MAILTVELTLTTTWQLVSANGFVGQKDASTAVEVCNADSLPSGTVDCHKVSEVENLQFPAPNAGSWYIRATTDDANQSFTFSEV